jgi:hypothetical protein
MDNQTSLSSSPCTDLYSTPAFLPLTSSAQAINWFLVIIVPFSICSGLIIFRYYQNRFVLLRKRPFNMACISSVGSLLFYIATCIRDAVGPMNFNCVLFALCIYMTIPLMVSPGLLRLAKFSTSLRVANLRARSHSLASTTNDNNNFGNIIFTSRPKATMARFLAYLKISFASNTFFTDTNNSNTVANSIVGSDNVADPPNIDSNGTSNHTNNNIQQQRVQISSNTYREALAFASSKAYSVMWMTFALVPYVIAFFIKLPLDPYWFNSCNGCDVDIFDVSFFIASTSVLMVIGVYLLKPIYFAPDPLYLFPEFVIGCGTGSIAVFGLLMHLFDPTLAFHRRETDWRWFIVLSTTLFALAQTYFPLALALYNRNKILSQVGVDRLERLQDVLQDKNMRLELHRHLIQEMSSESLTFIEHVDRYKKYYHKEHSDERAEEIYHAYIEPGCYQEINISSALRRKVMDVFEGHSNNNNNYTSEQQQQPEVIARSATSNGSAAATTTSHSHHIYSKEIFDECKDEMHRLLANDSFPRFLANRKATTTTTNSRITTTLRQHITSSSPFQSNHKSNNNNNNSTSITPSVDDQ